MKYPHIWRAVAEMPWAMEPVKLAAVRDLLLFRIEGGRLSADEIEARIASSRDEAAERHAGEPVQAAAGRGGDVRGSVQVIGVFGIISQRVSMMDALSGPGGTGTEAVSRQLREALAREDVASIVLNIDSPGGGVYGVAELADEIFKARGQKPIVAVANSQASSAAYWIACAAEELVVTPGGEVGSVGVYSMHEDISALLEMEGVRPSLISAGKFKVEANPFGPLSDEAREHIQSRVNDYYGMFTRAVAKYRRAELAAVKGGFGEGRAVGAQAAVRERMADRVGTLDEVVSQLASGKWKSPAAQRAERAELSHDHSMVSAAEISPETRARIIAGVRESIARGEIVILGETADADDAGRPLTPALSQGEREPRRRSALAHP